MRLSVVMAVHNGAASLESTLDSIQSQTFSDFELVVVNDGSRDETEAILMRRARADSRIHVLKQAHQGLTSALILGCMQARTDVIVRHDCGDRSRPERFARQIALLETGHVLVSCVTRFIEPFGHQLYVSGGDGEDVRRSLLHDDFAAIRSIPHHGSAMFRHDAYLRSGGYRPEFRVAQDLDLWIRMASLGTIEIAQETLYEATVDERSISGMSRPEQIQLTKIAVALRDGGDALDLLGAAEQVNPVLRSRSREAAALYFMGKCLLAQKHPEGRRYLRAALGRNPLHVRAAVSLLLNR